jgi:agmatine deiminase
MARMPAEWEPHAATWLAWPRNRKDWPGKFSAIPLVYAEIIRHLARFEPVELIVDDPEAEAKARRLLARAGAPAGNVRFHHWPTERIWVRDSGCSFVQGGAVTWCFNAWAKYPDFRRDQEIGRRMARAAGVDPARPVAGGRRVVLEGGSIEVNGRGTLITPEECLLSPVQQRNPGLDRAGYERVFAEHLGITRVIWLEGGIQGDDTHGHVDDLTRFVAADTVLTAVQPDPAHPDHAPLQENLPMPGPVCFGGVDLPASYANFYIANGLVLAPVFNDRNDRLALNLLAELFPDREVVGIYAGDLVLGFGALHCLTQQQPA